MPASDSPVTSLAGYRVVSSRPLPSASVPGDPEPAGQSDTLLERLAQSLEQRGIAYCQWKGHWSAHRWASGFGDVDLLVDHEAVPAFRRVVEELGFKLAYSSGGRQISGIENYFGHDPAVGRLLHLHVHYRLLLGDYWKPVYRIPVERSMLERSVPGHPFRVPAPTDRYLVFVLRMMLRQVGRPHLSARTLWTNGIRIQLASLEAGSNPAELASLLQEHLSPVDLPFFERCVRSLRGECGMLERAVLPWQLHHRLRAHARRVPMGALALGAVQKLLPEPVAERIADPRLRLAGGGLVLALIGAEGAGKSTCARELGAWLAPAFPTIRAHLGRPPRSLLTLLVDGALKLQHPIDRLLKRAGRADGSIELLRHLCTARDRFHLYEKVRRFAISGGIAVCEHYPVTQNRQLVGPTLPELLPAVPGVLARILRALETSYYTRILCPDVLLVLRLDPALTVARKSEQPADDVRTRAGTVRDADWSSTQAQPVDASQPLPEVIRRLKSMVWSLL
jgi:hypothetical protein